MPSYNGPHEHPRETATEHFPHFTLPGGERVSHGYTYAEWLDRVLIVLKQRYHLNRDPEARAQRAMCHCGWLHDYWESCYTPKQTAAEL